ncbi:MAG: LPS export ABC transporter permease LptG [Brachymonas denitrificans]|jgi:lipopolysaccharide export system permease protein|uniref:LPS export ABC transporter permease LptG n=1 Tax=Brachymonas denitrificans TaxID=28220 RepID=UPI001BCB549B|nr:LPS export ABC transporter permease LptG [Brachymonas denitrificans]
MKTAQGYIHRQIYLAVLFVTIGFLALFFFFDAVNDISYTSRNPVLQYTIVNALSYVGMLIPGHVYELLPIAVLIGTIFVMASLAQNSEFTILRTSGLSPARALRSLLWIGAIFGVLTFLVGDYVAPRTEKFAQNYKARFEGNLTSGRTGAWMKESAGGGDRIVNVQQLTPQAEMRNVRVFNFGADGALSDIVKAESGTFGKDGSWHLQNVQHTVLTGAAEEQYRIKREQLPTMHMTTEIAQSMVASALLEPDRMSALELYQYVSHLKSNNQSAQNYEIQFWRKVFYPLSCLVMVILALPFAYLHFRSGNITTAVFGGVVIGISFFLLNNVFGYIGNLNGWVPWVAAAIPSVIYTLISLGAFVWLVLKR